MSNRLNLYKSLGAKRLMLEAQELKERTEDYCAQPIEDNLYEWHFTVRGPPDTSFEGGYYHGRLSFPSEYPMKPPSIILYTPNGRFATNRMICLSISGFHPETWQPSWSIRTALLALIAFMPTQSHGAVGSLECSDERRRFFAKKSRTWRCETCGLIKDLLINPKDSNNVQQQKPSTSRVCDDSASTVQGNTQLKSSRCSRGADSVNNSENSGSSSEQCDSSPDSEQEKSSEKNQNPTVQASPQDSKGTKELKVQKLNSDHNNQVSSLSQNLLTHNQRVEEPIPLVRYPPLVIKSVFVLLSLLILRRIVMAIQS